MLDHNTAYLVINLHALQHALQQTYTCLAMLKTIFAATELRVHGVLHTC